MYTIEHRQRTRNGLNSTGFVYKITNWRSVPVAVAVHLADVRLAVRHHRQRVVHDRVAVAQELALILRTIISAEVDLQLKALLAAHTAPEKTDTGAS